LIWEIVSFKNNSAFFIPSSELLGNFVVDGMKSGNFVSIYLECHSQWLGRSEKILGFATAAFKATTIIPESIIEDNNNNNNEMKKKWKIIIDKQKISSILGSTGKNLSSTLKIWLIANSIDEIKILNKIKWMIAK